MLFSFSGLPSVRAFTSGLTSGEESALPLTGGELSNTSFAAFGILNPTCSSSLPVPCDFSTVLAGKWFNPTADFGVLPVKTGSRSTT